MAPGPTIASVPALRSPPTTMAWTPRAASARAFETEFVTKVARRAGSGSSSTMSWVVEPASR